MSEPKYRIMDDDSISDDLLPQPNWPEGHAPRVPALIEDLEGRSGFVSTKMAWASGLMMLVRTDG